jgi:hypothetical protein
MGADDQTSTKRLKMFANPAESRKNDRADEILLAFNYTPVIRRVVWLTSTQRTLLSALESSSKPRVSSPESAKEASRPRPAPTLH